MSGRVGPGDPGDRGAASTQPGRPPVMSRFVILSHDHPFPHWDLMLEHGDALRTWRLDGVPRPGALLGAEPLPDHRKTYLDYEGPVGGGRGAVAQVDAGNYCILKSDESGLVVRLDNGRNRMLATLQIDGDAQLWRFEAAGPES